MSTRGHHGLLFGGGAPPPPSSKKLIALGAVSGGLLRLSASLDSSSWGSPVTPTGVSTLVKLLGLASGRLIAPHGVTTRRSDDDGATWASVTNPASQLSEGKPILTAAGTILVPVSGNNGMLRSTDNGSSYARVGTGKSAMRIGHRSGLTVSLANTTAPMYSTNDGSTWSALGARLDTMAEAFNAVSANGVGVGTRVIFGGQIWGGPYGVSSFIPAVARTANGTVWDFSPVSMTPNGSILALAYSGSRLVAATNAGAIYRSDDDGVTWTLCTGSVGAAPSAAEWDGAHFVIVGGTSAGKIVGSSDGATFTARTHPLTDAVYDLAVIP